MNGLFNLNKQGCIEHKSFKLKNQEGLKIIREKIPKEISEALDNKFAKYLILNNWQINNVYYLCIYSNKCLYFCRFKLGQGFPYRSIFIELDNKISLSVLKKEIKKIK